MKMCFKVRSSRPCKIGLRPATLLKKRLWHRRFSVSFSGIRYVFLLLKSRSPLPKNLYLLQWKHFENDEKCFYFMFKTLFVLKIFIFLSRIFSLISKFMTTTLGNKLLQYTYYPIFPQVKASRQWDLVSQ